MYIYVALASYNTGYLTLPMESIENLVDEASHIAVLDGRGRIVRRGGWDDVRRNGRDMRMGDQRQHKRERARDGHAFKRGREKEVEVDWKTAWSEGTDAVMDVPIGGVCEVLYGEG